MNEWMQHDHALSYLSAADKIPHRMEGEHTLLEILPQGVRRVLDLGCGDGRLLALVLEAQPQAVGIGIDFSPTMLQGARERFAGTANVTIIEHDLDRPLPEIGRFDAVVSSFAIHHCDHERHEDTQLRSGFSTRHWNGRNSASFAKSRALAVITVIPKRPALIAISESFVKRPFPICS